MHRGRSVCRVPAMQPVIHAALLSNCTPFFEPLHCIAKQTNRSETKTAFEVSPRESKGKTVKKLPFTLYTKNKKKNDNTHSCLKSICGSTWIEPGVNSVERFRMAGSFVFLVGPHRRNSYRGSSGSAGARCRAE